MFCIYKSHINRRDPVFYIFDVVGNLSLNLKVELCYHSMTAAGVYHVVILCTQLTRDPLAIAKFLVKTLSKVKCCFLQTIVSTCIVLYRIQVLL